MATRRDTQKAKTRERLYATAMRLFLRRGFERVGVDDIVRACRVARGTFYFHFPSKDDVLLEAVRRGEARILGRLETEHAPTTRVALAGAIAAFAEEWEGRRTLWPHAGAVALRRIGAEAEGRANDPLRLALARTFEQGIVRREIASTLGPQMLADIFLLDVFAGLMAWSARGEPPLSVVLPGVVELFLRGVEGVGR
ncbi:MAG: TetR/AcrR family transcriptional regulator [Myxococcales bacterium]|nr:TetR/AcrR family transcriptional regulator [Myxococcales bacterium]